MPRFASLLALVVALGVSVLATWASASVGAVDAPTSATAAAAAASTSEAMPAVDLAKRRPRRRKTRKPTRQSTAPTTPTEAPSKSPTITGPFAHFCQQFDVYTPKWCTNAKRNKRNVCVWIETGVGPRGGKCVPLYASLAPTAATG